MNRFVELCGLGFLIDRVVRAFVVPVDSLDESA